MKSVYSLHCTVCSNDLDGRSSWLKHLIQADHQNKAREKCMRSWFTRKCKDKLVEEEDDEIVSLVVIFSSFSLNQLVMLENVLEKLSEIGGGSGFTWITDFVWWPERDRVGYLQFESQKIVNELFGILDGPNLQVDNKLVQLKRAVDIPHLEFTALLPREIANEIFLQENTGKGEEVTTTITPPQVPSLPPSSPQIPVSSYIPNAKTDLQLQFNCTCKSTEIPDNQFNQALQITQNLQNLLTQKHRKSAKVLIFRNFYLRLKNNGTNTLTIYEFIPDESSPHGFSSVDKASEDTIFGSSQFQESFPNFVRRRPSGSSPADGGTIFLNQTTNFQFNLIFSPLLIVEAHLSLLIQYLCSFDAHLKPVLLLVHYWARANRVRIAEKGVEVRAHNSICPEPSALEWMVILFLAREGLLPRVREVVERPHQVMSVGGWTGKAK